MLLLKKIFLSICLISLLAVSAADEDDNDGTNSNDTEQVTVDANSKDAIGNMLLQSISLMGIPYKWGGNTPQTGMDCSGFIRYVFQKSLGITLPRTAAQMATVGRRINLDELEPGDLIFFAIHHRRIDHVGMYIGDNKFIQSPHTGDSIKITELTDAWKAKIAGAKRIVQEEEDNEGNTSVESYQEITDEALPVRSGYAKRRVSGHRPKAHYKSAKTKSGNKANVKKAKRSSNSPNQSGNKKTTKKKHKS